MSDREILAFSDPGKELGRLELKNGKLCFTGDVDKSAKILFDSVVKQFNEQVKP